LSSNRDEVTVVELHGKIYVMGGFKYYGAVTSRAVEVYDPQTDRWEEKAALPGGRHHTAAAVVNGKIYVIGGFMGIWNWHTLTRWKWKATSDVWEYDPGQNRWRERAPMPTARGAHALGVIDGKIYAVGGKIAHKAHKEHEGGKKAWPEEILNTFEVYDPVADSWQALPPMPTPRDHHAAAVLDGRLYAIGGRQGSIGSSMGVNEIYDPNTKQWTTKAPMPSKRSGIAAAVLGRRIYVFGGEGRGDDYITFDATESYSPDTDQWMTHTPMPGTRHGLGAAVFGGRIYVIGGSPKWGSVRGSNANEVFTPEGRGPQARP